MRKCDIVVGEFGKLKIQIKDNIVLLINKNKLQEAQCLLNQYGTMVKNDPDYYSMLAVIYINQGILNEAKETLEKGLHLDENNFDLLYNLAYIYELKNEYKYAAKIYSSLKHGNYNNEQKNLSKIGLERVSSQNITDIEIENKPKLVFFVKQGMDSFLGDIIKELSDSYETKKIIVTNYNQVDSAMSWSDICWFEWCDDLICYASQLPVAATKKLFAGYIVMKLLPNILIK